MNKVVFVIDLIKGFTVKGDLSDKRINSVIPVVKDILNNQKENIYFICDSHSENDIEMQQYPIHCISNTEESEVVDELKPFVLKNESNIIRKNTTNGFHEVKKSLLRKFDEFVLVGCCTDICVMQFALSLKTWLNKFHLDKNVVVYENGVNTFDSPEHNGDEFHEFALKIMRNAGIIIKEWK